VTKTRAFMAGPENPGIEVIRIAVQMLNAPGAPTFVSKPEKVRATVDLAHALAAPGKRRRP
jgi:hypothetical protein